MRPLQVLVALALVLALTACGGAGRGAAAGGVHDGEVLDGAWPLATGGEIDLATLRGRVVVVHVFTTWSIASDEDVAELRAARALAPDEVVLVSLGLDPDGAALLLPWRDAVGCDWPVAMPTQDVLAGESALGDVMALVPRTAVLDRRGRVAWSHEGVLTPGALPRVVRDALARK